MVLLNIMYVTVLLFNSLRFFCIFPSAFPESNIDEIANKLRIKDIRGCLYSLKQRKTNLIVSDYVINICKVKGNNRT